MLIAKETYTRQAKVGHDGIAESDRKVFSFLAYDERFAGSRCEYVTRHGLDVETRFGQVLDRLLTSMHDDLSSSQYSLREERSA